MIRYRHTQFGWVTTIASLSGAIGLFVFTKYLGAPRAVIVAAFVLILPLLLFFCLTTEVTETTFAFSFGIGWIHKTILRSEIAVCRVVTNPWWYGWGIHKTPRGWLYNVSGPLAVEIDLTDGQRLRVGTDEPEALCSALRPAVTPAHGRSY